MQPAVIAGGDLLIGSGSGLADNTGMLRVTVAHEPGGWIVKERWTSTGLKPYFNDFVVHQGHAFGFDGSILACIDLEDGTAQVEGRTLRPRPAPPVARPGLVARAVGRRRAGARVGGPDKFTELARFPAIEGKTWNHPVLVGDVLLVRNGEEMAAFRLSLAGR